MGWVRGIVIYLLARHTERRLAGDGPARVRIPVKTRVITAGDVHSDAVSRSEDIRRHSGLDYDFLNFAGAVEL